MNVVSFYFIPVRAGVNPINFINFKGKRMEYNIKLKNGLVLRGMINSPGQDVHAIIVFVHGVGEHIHRYDEWAADLVRDGIGFTGVDLPGHGLSDGARGHIRDYSLTDEMLNILIESASKTFRGVPVFIYGHSLGGGIVLDYIIRKNPVLKGAIVSSPWLKLSFEPAKSKVLLAKIMKSIWPGLAQPTGLVVDHLSHDTVVVEKYKADPLVHGKISVGLFHNAMQAGAYALAHASELKVPLLLMHGSDDKICSPEGSREFASKTQLAELKIWDGGYHELHNEVFKNEVFQYLVKWINTRLA
jgi:alpha-beta hydrolase superfamily lysophospholipase